MRYNLGLKITMNQDLQLFTSTATAVFLEASPFLLLGALLSSVFEVYLPQESIERYLPNGLLLGVLFGLSAGMLIPTCECGVVTIVRRLLKKGVPPHVAMTYMLSAPVINPLTLAATYVAFRGNIWMVLGRIGMVAVCASCLGLALARINPVLLLRGREPEPDLCDHGHTNGNPANANHMPHANLEGAHGCGCSCAVPNGSRLIRVFQLTASEFLDMGTYLILGALAVSFFRTFLHQEWLAFFQNNVFLAIGMMMLLAFFLSICSQADAFVAASFVTFPAMAQLSFVALGPMVDLKLVTMYAAVFRKRIALTLIVVPIILIYILSLLIGIMTRS
ncbi:MAG: permease [Desulfobaccales bacterium]